MNDIKTEQTPICNMCGELCMLTTSESSGLINQTVCGGYESTPGNGHGALDDCNHYTFSLCEFCLDWLFSQFKIPVKIKDYYTTENINWLSATQRVNNDDWRTLKKEFFDEKTRRDLARKIKITQ